MNENGFYSRLQHFAKAGKWQKALTLMRVGDLPLMKAAFRTTRSFGDGRFEMVFRFRSMEEMHSADREWHDFRKATDQ